jgi:hypothetical protein
LISQIAAAKDPDLTFDVILSIEVTSNLDQQEGWIGREIGVKQD